MLVNSQDVENSTFGIFVLVEQSIILSAFKSGASLSDFRISVVIPAYNSLDFLRQTIAGLEEQEVSSPAFEVIVVNDGSTDGTADFLDSYHGSLNLRPIHFPHNRGRSAARNAAISAVNSDLILFLDADMRSSPNLISYHIASHVTPNIAIIGKVEFSPDVRLGGYSKYWMSRGAQRLSAKTEVEARYFLSGHSSIPTQLARKIGGFDEEISYYGEDIDFGIRLYRAGARIVYDPGISTIHLHQRSLSDILKVLFNYGRLTIPILLQKHPFLRQTLRIEWGEAGGGSGLIRRALLSSLFYYPLRLVGIVFDSLGITSALYTYLSYRNYFSGYKLSRKAQ